MHNIGSEEVIKAIGITGGLLIATLIIVGLAMWGVYKFFRDKDNKFK